SMDRPELSPTVSRGNGNLGAHGALAPRVKRPVGSSVPANRIIPIIDAWLEKCKQRGKISRNTIAVGIVVLHHLRQKCPLAESDVFSRGGELIGARSTLAKTLAEYGVPPNFLKEATNRQAAPFARRLFEALNWGRALAGIPTKERQKRLTEGITRLTGLAHEWLGRQHLKITCDRQHSPIAWIGSILEHAKGRSGGKVEQHLVGAKLEKRFPQANIPNNPGHAGDVQTGRAGDFPLGTTVYHVTAAPSRSVIEKCGANLAARLHPVLLVPRDAVAKAVHVAEDSDLDKRISIVAIEDFIALNILEMSDGRDAEFVRTLEEIVGVYNRRLSEVETDMSLKIEIE
ncbi:MAG: DUF4928 family protein, partial [Vicinamibacterales bacterium]